MKPGRPNTLPRFRPVDAAAPGLRYSPKFSGGKKEIILKKMFIFFPVKLNMMFTYSSVYCKFVVVGMIFQTTDS